MSKKSFSQRIKDARLAAALSQAAAARKWGFSKQTLCAWENGTRNPAGLYAGKLERILRRQEKLEEVRRRIEES